MPEVKSDLELDSKSDLESRPEVYLEEQPELAPESNLMLEPETMFDLGPLTQSELEPKAKFDPVHCSKSWPLRPINYHQFTISSMKQSLSQCHCNQS